MKDVDSLIEQLESAHSFPGPFTFKIIGPNTPAFRTEVQNRIGPRTVESTQERLSKNDAHVAITIRITVPSAQDVLNIYQELSNITNVKYVL